MKTTINSSFGVESELWQYGIALIFILPPIAWVRDISKFSFTYLLGNLLLLVTVIVVVINGFIEVYNPETGMGWQTTNLKKFDQ